MIEALLTMIEDIYCSVTGKKAPEYKSPDKEEKATFMNKSVGDAKRWAETDYLSY